MKRTLMLLLFPALCLCPPARAGAQQTSDIKIEKPERYGAAPGLYTAEFRLRLPIGRSKDKPKYVIVLVPGYNRFFVDYCGAKRKNAFR